MRIKQTFTIVLNGITSDDLTTRENRLIVADAIFMSAKYLNTTIDTRIGASYLESIDVNGDTDIFSQYEGDKAEKLTRFGTYTLTSASGDDARRKAMTVGRQDEIFAGKNYSGMDMDSEDAVVVRRRAQSSSVTLDCALNIVTPGRYQVDWEVAINVLLENLRTAITSGTFNTRLYQADTKGIGFPLYDGHWNSRRRLGAMSGAAVDSG